MKFLGLVLSVFLAGTFTAFGGAIPSPEQQFGFAPGTDRKLADWTQLVGYFRTLGTGSDRVHFEELGKTTEGRPYIALTISSPDNLAHLAEYKAITQKLSDARATAPDEAAKLIARGKIILVVTCNLHSTEIAPGRCRRAQRRPAQPL